MNNLKANELKLELEKLSNLTGDCDRLRSEMYREYTCAVRGRAMLNPASAIRVSIVDTLIGKALDTIQYEIDKIEDMLNMDDMDFKDVDERH